MKSTDQQKLERDPPDPLSMSELTFFSCRLPQFKEEAKSYVGANMKKVGGQRCSIRLSCPCGLWTCMFLLFSSCA